MEATQIEPGFYWAKNLDYNDEPSGDPFVIMLKTIDHSGTQYVLYPGSDCHHSVGYFHIIRKVEYKENK